MINRGTGNGVGVGQRFGPGRKPRGCAGPLSPSRRSAPSKPRRELII